MNECRGVFLGLIDICGVYRTLEHALKQKGVRAYFLNTGVEHRAGRHDPPGLVKAYLRLLKTDPSGKGGLPRVLRTAALKAAILALIVWIILRFDVAVFKSGMSFTDSGVDLRILRWFGVKIVVTYHGSDSRPGYLAEDAPTTLTLAAFMARQEAKRARVMRSHHLADYVIDSPASSHWQPGRCCLRQVIFNPAPPLDIAPLPEEPEQDVTVLHCPSSADLKGTGTIRAVVAQLKAEGLDFDFVEMMGVPNEEVLRAIQRATLVVDELYSDNYGGILALESVVLNVPVIVCGYGKQVLDAHVPGRFRLPTTYLHPDALADGMRRMIEDRRLRDACRERSRIYAREVAEPQRCAERFLTLVTGQAPDEWFFDAADTAYLDGACRPDTTVRRTVADLIDLAGPEALMLDDKPSLRAAFIAAAHDVVWKDA